MLRRQVGELNGPGLQRDEAKRPLAVKPMDEGGAPCAEAAVTVKQDRQLRRRRVFLKPTPGQRTII